MKSDLFGLKIMYVVLNRKKNNKELLYIVGRLKV